ncbi:2-oxo acid dehydrogenase subunit E2 [Streptomyces sp. IB2014 016-6]|uniref:2-oxo acid dehydrogenase subunit E2 n=1 Tax=Streptomyces sp. IB2014 016-6 TaxID=2517818 RepID=UPI0011C73159|nr:2-oxo acid dehydrogenase subunit E2 [Streptomyces sp. IB2014 016-6]TXL85735.1 dehydrogenase [Streptomyces sp. IB2014 016-6]
MTEIRVPKLNNNDTEYTLVEWLVDDGKPIAEGDPVALVETSKAAEELESAAEGVLRQSLAAGAVCAPGDVIGHVLAPGETVEAAPVAPVASAAPVPGAESSPAGVTITKPARVLMSEWGIGEEQVLGWGLKVVRRTDVERLAGPPPTGKTETVVEAETVGETETKPASPTPASPARTAPTPASPAPTALTPTAPTHSAKGTVPMLSQALPSVQQAVGRSVLTSHQTIPAAYTVVKVDVTGAQTLAAQEGKRLRRLVGLPELLLSAVARSYRAFPLCFARLADARTAELADAAHVGVTMDVGQGLFVPVVERASDLTFEEIVEAVSGFRRTVMSGTFRESELSGGNITVTLHNDLDVVAAVPFVFPGQACALALAGPQQELFLDSDGAVTARTVVNVGLAYDHRLLNGRDAVLFLQRVKALLQSPEKLLGEA